MKLRDFIMHADPDCALDLTLKLYGGDGEGNITRVFQIGGTTEEKKSFCMSNAKFVENGVVLKFSAFMEDYINVIVRF